jgi:hypothetical protein
MSGRRTVQWKAIGRIRWCCDKDDGEKAAGGEELDPVPITLFPEAVAPRGCDCDCAPPPSSDGPGKYTSTRIQLIGHVWHFGHGVGGKALNVVPSTIDKAGVDCCMLHTPAGVCDGRRNLCSPR